MRLPFVLTLAALAPVGGASLPAAPMPAPYQVEGWTIQLDGSGDEQGKAIIPNPVLAVDLGASEGRSLPERNAGLARWTVLGTAGSSAASLIDIWKKCEFLCGNEVESEECHYVADLSVPGGDTIGIPLAAVPVSLETSDWVTVEGPFDAAPAALDWWAAEPNAAMWPEDVKHAVRAGAGGDWQLDSDDAGWKTSTPLGECTSRQTGSFREVRCQGAAILASEGRILLASQADYNMPSAEVVASFRHAGATWHIVRLGLKAQTVYGLLGPDGLALFRPRDYALLC